MKNSITVYNCYTSDDKGRLSAWKCPWFISIFGDAYCVWFVETSKGDDDERLLMKDWDTDKEFWHDYSVPIPDWCPIHDFLL